MHSSFVRRVAGVSLFAALIMATPIFATRQAFASSGTDFAQVLTFLNPSPGVEDFFGSSVASLGGNVVIGAPGDDTAGTNTGIAYLFDGATGNLIRTFEDPNPDPDGFGISVAVVGDDVLIGAPFDSTGATFAGVAHLFDGATGQLIRTFVNPTPAAGEDFGIGLAAFGDDILIGGQGTDAVYLYDGLTGELIRTFSDPMGGAFGFGISVAATGGNVLVGDLLRDIDGTSAGAAYLFDGSTGQLIHTFLNPTPAGADFFGLSLASLNGRIYIGAFQDSTAGPYSGTVYVFDEVTGRLLQTIFNPTPDGIDAFGFSLATVGNNLVVGAPLDSAVRINAGTVYVFDAITGLLVQTILDPGFGVDDSFGQSLAKMDSGVIIGAPRDDTGATDSGAAYLFGAIPSVRQVQIDILPGSNFNFIRPGNRAPIPVAILSDAGLDAPAQVDRSSLSFGRTGDEPSLVSCDPSPRDVNLDGLPDLVCRFSTLTAGFQSGDVEGILRGRLFDGTLIEGRDFVSPVPPAQSIPV